MTQWVVKGNVAEVDTDTGVASLNKETGKVKEVERDGSDEAELWSLGVCEGRVSQEQAYCEKYNQEIETQEIEVTLREKIGVEFALALCDRTAAGSRPWSCRMAAWSASPP